VTGLLTAAFVGGVAATALYDLFRFAVLWSGLMDRDPIPHIGVALGLEPAWFFGYLWRYLGDGGGLALAFLVLGWRGARAGVVFGLFVCAGLLATLAVSPYGQQMLFPLTPVTVAMATVGHLIYGAVLGAYAARRPAEEPCGSADGLYELLQLTEVAALVDAVAVDPVLADDGVAGVPVRAGLGI
jgi:hypothetical protein